MTRFILTLICSILLPQTQSIDLNCDYNTPVHKSVKHNYIMYSYTCKITNQLNITSKTKATVNLANGTHTEDKSNKDVESFSAIAKNIQYFPRKLEKIFPNLKGINLLNNGLKELDRQDLKHFPKLNNLNLAKNDIQVLEDGIFDNNPELVIIDLDNNKIIHVDTYVFERLTKLIYLGLSFNPCINSTARNASTINEVINTTLDQCFVEEFQILSNIEADFKAISLDNQQEFKLKIINLEQRFQNSRLLNNTSVRQRVELLSEWKSHALWTLKDQIQILKNSNAEMLKIIKKQNYEIDEMSVKYTRMMAVSIFSGFIVFIILIGVRRKV